MAAQGQMALSRAPRISTAPQVPKNARQGVPAFLQKLFEMLNDPNSSGLIHWSESGDSFFVLDHERFAQDILPRWFKHKNFASFVRQLNMYGFHKIPHLQQGVLRSDTGENEYWNFAHENFRREQPDLLCLIQRKKGTSNAQQQQGSALSPEEGIIDVRDPNIPSQQPATAVPAGLALPPSAPGAGQVLDINQILQGIAAIKKHQTTISEDLQQLKQSNELLWQDAMTARQRLQKNEDTVQRIVKFLAGVFGNRRTEAGHGHPGHEHGHAGHHPGHEGKEGSENRNEGAVIPVQRRTRRTPSSGAGRRPRLMIEGAKDTGKGTSGVGIVEVGENDPDDAVNIIVDGDHDDEDDIEDEDDHHKTEIPESNLGSGTNYNNAYAIETPNSVPSPSPSIAQSDTAGPTIREATSSPNVATNSNFYGSLNDAVMRDGTTQPSSLPTSTNANAATSTALDHAVAPPRIATSSPNPIFNIPPEQLNAILALFQHDPSTLSTIDPNLAFPASSDSAEPGQLTAFNPGAPSPPSFDFSSLGSPGHSGFPGFPALLSGSPAHPAGTASTPPGSENLLSFGPEDDSHGVSAAISPRLERHWNDVQDVDKDVSESENQINTLIESLGPLAQYIGPHNLAGLGPMPHVTSTSHSTQNTSLPQAAASSSSPTITTTKHHHTGSLDGGGGTGISNDTEETDISSFDPTHLSIPSGLEHTDFNFHSFFPHPSTSTSTMPSTAHPSSSSSTSTTTSTANTKPGVIDSTMDINFDMGDISGMGGISPYNDLNSGTAAAFLSEVPSPAPSTASTTTAMPGVPGSPVQSTVKANGRKRKSDAMAMSELEGALMGTNASSVGGGGGGGVKDGGGGGTGEATKAKRRKD
ncbi:hypothetical protein NP233_g2473 [Leucocoprinus birnbaumii]|uniref:HSF-type DNA-binding domain-containing protein n=1 Tax=Leucocoprinus birnbaumii TaxID=56174 RepID=A0AAD5YZ19_9AGAR|nr:hypothetical protein NP233_g2473 [Leucocoprinus birnbaumii]